MPHTFDAHTFDAAAYNASTFQGEEGEEPPPETPGEVFGDDVESGVTPGVGDIALKSTGGFA